MSYPNDEAEDRVIARALDAEETDEAAMDRATVEEYQKVLAYLPFDEVAPPVAVEQRVFDAALAARPAAATSIHRRPASKRRATARWITLGAAVAAAAAVVAFMFTTSGDSGGVGGRVELASASGSAEIVEQPGAKVATLTAKASRVPARSARSRLRLMAKASSTTSTSPTSPTGRSRLGLARRERQARTDRRDHRPDHRNRVLQGHR